MKSIQSIRRGERLTILILIVFFLGMGVLVWKVDGIYDLVNKEIFWAAGKVYALSMEDGPIAMIDTDFIVWKPLEELIKESSLAVIHRCKCN